MHVPGNRVTALLLALLFPACVDLTGLRDAFDHPCGPGGCQVVSKPCSELLASQLSWTVRGFEPKDILNPDLRDQRELTAVLRAGDVKTLSLSATGMTSEDCTSKAISVEWTSSNGDVAELTAPDNPRVATLSALAPGDTVVAAVLAFQDGSPPVRVLPWSFTNIGSGNVTVVRVVP